ncbi:hypothetical protein [Rubripirellula lacrimiformis]|uniref:hypothetical protein n=1 Tax=Rubripirellula lacrimiformis TaxID=1930273 RepID=UPI0011A458BA|nr:hypothetical protein [Rubripirellula lacrimiformis]
MFSPTLWRCRDFGVVVEFDGEKWEFIDSLGDQTTNLSPAGTSPAVPDLYQLGADLPATSKFDPPSGPANAVIMPVLGIFVITHPRSVRRTISHPTTDINAAASAEFPNPNDSWRPETTANSLL